MNTNTLKKETGALLTEYSLAIGLTVLIFLAISTVLYNAGKHRAEESVGSMKNMAPCIENPNATPPDCPLDFTGKKCCYP